jgi:Flp pilus assembly pilin Flp
VIGVQAVDSGQHRRGAADEQISRCESEAGQTMVEYGFVVVAVALAALAAYQAFGDRVSALVNTVNIS